MLVMAQIRSRILFHATLEFKTNSLIDLKKSQPIIASSYPYDVFGQKKRSKSVYIVTFSIPSRY